MCLAFPAKIDKNFSLAWKAGSKNLHIPWKLQYNGKSGMGIGRIYFLGSGWKTADFQGKIYRLCKFLGVKDIKGQMLVMKNLEGLKRLNVTDTQCGQSMGCSCKAKGRRWY